MTIKEKILSFLAGEGIRKADFFETVGIVPSNFKGVARQSELGGDKIAKILTSYPRLSAEWLLRDEGEMLRGGVSEQTAPVLANPGSSPEAPRGESEDNELGVLKERIRGLEALVASQRETIEALKKGKE